MSQILAISSDMTASPGIRLSTATQGAPVSGLGMAWYPSGDSEAALFKDPTDDADAMSRMLSDWRRFKSVVFVCHLLTDSRRRSQEDTNPFRRLHGGRTWLMAHNGSLSAELAGDLATSLPLGASPVFTPLGRTDSEHAFCWLMTKVRESNATSLAEVGYATLHEWSRELNQLGTVNLVVTDGHDVVAYRDRNGFNGLSCVRRVPPHRGGELSNDAFALDLDSAETQTTVIFATQAMTAAVDTENDDQQAGVDGPAALDWKPLEHGQMLVARRGAFIWDSTNQPSRTRPGVVQTPMAPMPPEAIAATGGRNWRVQADQGQAQAPDGAVGSNGRILTLFHRTTYRYAKPVERSEHTLRLFPVQDRTQRVHSGEVILTPAGRHHDFEDVFGNQVRHVVVEDAYSEMTVLSTARVELLPELPLATMPSLHLERLPMVWMPWQRQMMAPYLLPVELPEAQLRELTDYAMSFVERQNYDLVETLLDINQGIYRDFQYVTGSTRLETTPFEVLNTRKGVCQDFANLMICLARLLNIPARYRVGYIFTGGAYENKIQSDASHAWLELYLPGVGWRGFDPTNGCQVGLDHVRVACGRNYRDATPTAGTIFAGGGTETMSIDVKLMDASTAPI